MNRRVLLAGSILGVLASSLPAEGQTAGKVARIGFLSLSPLPSAPGPAARLQQGLYELGWVEGQNIVAERRYAAGKLDRLADMAAELVRLRLDVIVAASDPAIDAVKKSTSTIPIVMAPSGDPVAHRFVASLARPGGNVTGLTTAAPEMGGKRLELLRETVPGLSSVAVLWDSSDPSKALEWRQTQPAAVAMGLKLHSIEVRIRQDFAAALSATVAKNRPDALLVFGNPVTLAQRREIVEFAAKKRLPAMYSLREFVEVGGLVSYGSNLEEIFRRAAYYVDRILRGAKAADLPVEQPTKFELVINLKTAQALGLTIPPSLLVRADHVIE